MFVLHRIRRTVRHELDHVGLADQTKAVAEQRKRALDAKPVAYFKPGGIDALVQCLTTLCEQVFFEYLFDVNECALARTVAPMLERREGDGSSRSAGMFNRRMQRREIFTRIRARFATKESSHVTHLSTACQ